MIELGRVRTERGIPGSAHLAAASARARGGRVVTVASADRELRRRLAQTLQGLRWEVSETEGGAGLFEIMAQPGRSLGTVLLDSWLPDLDVAECVRELGLLSPDTDVFAIDGTDIGAEAPRGAFRNEVLHALRVTQQAEEAAWVGASSEAEILRAAGVGTEDSSARPARGGVMEQNARGGLPGRAAAAPGKPAVAALPELLGKDPRMLEVARRIRLVAPRATTVLVQGPTGTGKELVARALHRLSPRAARPFVALNCAAIPEALLEAELFGHTRGAFTGAVQGRTGRLEAAHGGTLFLDEIGELPLVLQAKLLRFIECGELQRVGENEPVRVDVRVIAATHRKLGQMAEGGAFRADLYYRLSVFLIKTPALAERGEDIALLAQHVMARMARSETPKRLSPAAIALLLSHGWPGNVRELEHTLERAWILAEERAVIEAEDIDFGQELGE